MIECQTYFVYPYIAACVLLVQDYVHVEPSPPPHTQTSFFCIWPRNVLKQPCQVVKNSPHFMQIQSSLLHLAFREFITSPSQNLFLEAAFYKPTHVGLGSFRWCRHFTFPIKTS